jgi:serine-type D-Ala-D-Ala carboxypeptidase (penicillin-binding protein 5/6)
MRHLKALRNRSKWTTRVAAVTLVTTCFVTSINLSSIHAQTDATLATPPTINAAAAELIDAKTGQILYEKNIHDRREPASTTKIMTMLLIEQAIANGQVKLTDPVEVTPEAVKIETEGSGAWLKEGEKWTMEDMLKFIAVPSGNDAAVAAAQKLAGSIPAFVDRMNQEAKKLGLNDTHFANPDGLHDPNHYTSAHDLAIMARELITKHPDVLKYTSIQSLTVRNGQNVFMNTDQLLGKYPGLDGLKTGFTDEAGYCFVGTAEQNGMRLISVVLGANSDESRFTETTKLLDFGFHNFKEFKLAAKDEPLKDSTVTVEKGVSTKVSVAPAQDLIVTLQPGQEKQLVKKVTFNSVQAPVKKGQVVGTLQYVLNGKVVQSVDLQATEDDDKASFLRLFFRGIGNLIGSVFHGIVSGIGHLFK